MLSVQPKLSNNYGPAFGAQKKQSRKLTPEELEEKKYNETRQELLEQKEDLDDMLDNDEFKLPKPVQIMIKVGTIIATVLLSGMATGWGTKKSIQAMSKISESAPVQSLKKHIKATNSFIIASARTVKTKFKASEAYTMPANALKKFSKTKIGSPIAKFFKAIGKGIKNIFTTIKKGFNHIMDKIKGVKKETYEKATVNFVGASGGVASGVTTLKEQDEAGDK